jgi:hypothetical protein
LNSALLRFMLSCSKTGTARSGDFRLGLMSRNPLDTLDDTDIVP